MSGLHLESVTWPSGGLSPVFLNNSKGFSTKSRSYVSKSGQNTIELGECHLLFSFINLAMALATLTKSSRVNLKPEIGISGF